MTPLGLDLIKMIINNKDKPQVRDRFLSELQMIEFD